jgi:predicted XRE-type DNA-binding protein
MLKVVAEPFRLIKDGGLTLVKAAGLVGISQPDLSLLLRGDFDNHSAERLKMLTAFEQEIEIVMKPHRRAGKPGRIAFKAVAA